MLLNNSQGRSSLNYMNDDKKRKRKNSKVCQYCYKEKSLNDYLPDKRTSDGLRNYCQECEMKNKKPKKFDTILDDPSFKNKKSSRPYYDEDISFQQKKHQIYNDEPIDDIESSDDENEAYDATIDGDVKTNYEYYYVGKKFKVGTHKNIIMVGESGSGKTMILLEGMWEELNRYYDMVLLISPTLDAPIYQKNLTTIDRKLSFYGTHYESILKDILTFNSKCDIPLHILVVLDDMTTENLPQSKALNTLFCRGRNLNISCLVMVHMLTSISNIVRRNTHELWVKSIRSNEAVDDLREKYISDRVLSINWTSKKKKKIIKDTEKKDVITKWIDRNVDNPKHTGFVIQFQSHYNQHIVINKLPTVEMCQQQRKGKQPMDEDEHSSDVYSDEEEGELLSDFEEE